MFTLGNKEAIVNSTTQYPITWTSPADLIVIEGFGTFDQLKVTDADGQRYQAPQYEKITFDAPSAADLAVTANGTPVVFHLRVNSLRQASETAIDFIKRGRPMIIELKVDAADTNTDVAIKLKAAFDEYTNKFLNATLPVLLTNPAASTIEVEALQPWFQINDSVTFLKRGDIFGYEVTISRKFASTGAVAVVGAWNPVTGRAPIQLNGAPAYAALKVNDLVSFSGDAYATDFQIVEMTNVAPNTLTIWVTPDPNGIVAAPNTIQKTQKGVEAVNDGKYLEENVRMSTPFTSDTYAIKPQEVPIIGALYTMVSWTATDPVAGTTGGWAGHKVNDIKASEYAENRYTMYFNEAVCLANGGPVDKLVQWLLQAGTFVSGADFKKPNGASSEGATDILLSASFRA